MIVSCILRGWGEWCMKNTITIKQIMFCLIFFLAACAQKPLTWQEQYDLGVRYLSEGNYEEAIIAFTAAIEIAPRQADIFTGRGDTYAALAERESDRSDTLDLWEKAIADYERALDLGDTQAEGKLDESRERLQQLQDEENIRSLLEVLYVRLGEGDIEAAKDLMRQADYRTFSASISGGPYYYDHGDNSGLAVYPDDFYYFGQWENGLRSGQGLWIRAVFEDDSELESYTYEGTWANDRPNGEGHIIINRYPNKIQLEPGSTTSVRTETTGTFADGLYHGTIYEVWNMSDGSTHVWSPITAVNGVYQVIEKNGDRMIVAYDQSDSSTDLSDNGSVHAVQGFGTKS